MSGVNSSHQDVDIDLAQLFRAIWQRRTVVLGSTALVAALAFTGANLMAPHYKSETRILIEQRAPAFSKTDGAPATSEPVLDELNVASQVQLLQSVDLIKQVTRDFKLYDRPEFDADVRGSLMTRILVMLHLKKSPLELAPEERALQAFKEKLEVYQVEKSRVIGIVFDSRDPALSAAVPNAMAQLYLKLQSGAKLDSNNETSRWLEPEIATLRDRVKAAEEKVASYRSSAGLMSAGDNTTFASKQLTDISTELARVRGEMANAEARAENVRTALAAGRAADTITDVVGSPMIQRLKETESSIQSQISDLSITMMEGHPRLKGLRAQLSGIREQINSETRKILASLENDANVGRLRERQLLQQLNGVKADSAQAGEDEVGLKALEREATAQRQLLETYLGRYREAASRMDSNSSPADARVISTAVEPTEPYFPKVLPIVIVAAMATLVLSSVIIMIMELFSGRALKPVNLASSPAPAPTPTPTPVSGPGPGTTRAPTPAPVAVGRRKSASPVAAALADAIAAMQPSKPAEPRSAKIAEPEPLEEVTADEVVEADDAELVAQTVGVAAEDDFSIQAVAEYLIKGEIATAVGISPSGDDGSTAMVMLAREVAESGRKVILIDMTGTACPTKLMADIPGLPGITDLLCGEAAFVETIHPDRLSHAHLVPSGTADLDRALRGVDRLSMIVDALTDAYDLVLVECGPADIDSVARLTLNRARDIILSVPRPDEDQLEVLMGEFEQAGYSDVILMSGMRPSAVSNKGGRRAA
jgi:exopolysaccharide transport family protein